MNLTAKLLLTLKSGGQSYQGKVLSYSPIAYWPLNEASGTTADNAEGTAARDGTYSASDIAGADTGPDGSSSAPLFVPGDSDYCDVYSASLNGVFDGAEGTLALWFKVSGAGVWTDTTNRFMTRLQATSANKVEIYKDNQATGRLWVRHLGGGTVGQVIIAAATHGSPTTWTHVAISWSEGSDVVKVYLDGTQTGGDQSTIGTYTGSLNSANCTIGSSTTVPNDPFDGSIADVAVFDSALSAAAISDLATV